MSDQRTPQHEFDITLASHYSELERAVDRVSDFMDECTDDEDLAHRVLLAISEAISNGMEHGNQGDRERNVHVSLEAYRGEIIASVEDEGPGFDPDAIEDPMLEENLLKESGRGLHIMRSISERVWFEKGGCIIKMKFVGEIHCDDE